jgi:hypothetical protein
VEADEHLAGSRLGHWQDVDRPRMPELIEGVCPHLPH